VLNFSLIDTLYPLLKECLLVDRQCSIPVLN
jgi:hypothetical protein